jgi:hypothetical protein
LQSGGGSCDSPAASRQTIRSTAAGSPLAPSPHQARTGDRHASVEHGNVTTMRPCGRAWSRVLYNLPLEKIARVPKPTNKANQIGNRSACISICLQFQGTSCPSRETWGVIDCLKRTFSSRAFNLARSASGQRKRSGFRTVQSGHWASRASAQAATHVAAIVYQFALNPQRNLENRKSKYVEWVPSCGPPIFLPAPKDPSPRRSLETVSGRCLRGALSSILENGTSSLRAARSA